MPTLKEMQQELDAMKARTEAAEKRAAEAEAKAAQSAKVGPTGIGLKVAEKGGVSLYGLQRMPITLYAQQWEKLFTHIDEIKLFIAANNSTLSRKPVAGKPATVAPVAQPSAPVAE